MCDNLNDEDNVFDMGGYIDSESMDNLLFQLESSRLELECLIPGVAYYNQRQNRVQVYALQDKGEIPTAVVLKEMNARGYVLVEEISKEEIDELILSFAQRGYVILQSEWKVTRYE